MAWFPGDPRCPSCDNGVSDEWIACPFCGDFLNEADKALHTESRQKWVCVLLTTAKQAGEALGALDRDIYDQRRAAEFDAPDDAEWCVRVGTLRKIEKVLADIEQLRAKATS